MHAKLGFNFYGHGNAGDDLMLAGFLKVWAGRKQLFGVVSPEQRSILRLRFPEISWLVQGEKCPPFDLWVGVGDTPIQVLSGPGFLEFLEHELLESLPTNVPAILVGIGVEKEAVRELERFRKVLDRIELISTRDDASRDILIGQFHYDTARIVSGADLAHIFLGEVFVDLPELDLRPLAVALNLYGENATRWQWFTAHAWLQDCGRECSVASLANESRLFRGSEAWRYAELCWSLFMRRPVKGVPPLCGPNRWAVSTHDLVAHFPAIQTILSARYHCLVAGAWAGCRLGVLSRSSKIEALASQLALPLISSPFGSSGLNDLRERATVVPLEKLSNLAMMARESTTKVLAL